MASDTLATRDAARELKHCQARRLEGNNRKPRRALHLLRTGYTAAQAIIQFVHVWLEQSKEKLQDKVNSRSVSRCILNMRRTRTESPQFCLWATSIGIILTGGCKRFSFLLLQAYSSNIVRTVNERITLADPYSALNPEPQILKASAPKQRDAFACFPTPDVGSQGFGSCTWSCQR